jgi:hypothetical protein
MVTRKDFNDVCYKGQCIMCQEYKDVAETCRVPTTTNGVSKDKISTYAVCWDCLPVNEKSE